MPETEPNRSWLAIAIAAVISLASTLPGRAAMPPLPCVATYYMIDAWTNPPVNRSVIFGWRAGAECDQISSLQTACDLCVNWQIQVKNGNNWVAYTTPKLHDWFCQCTLTNPQWVDDEVTNLPNGTYRLYVNYWLNACGNLLYDFRAVEFRIF